MPHQILTPFCLNCRLPRDAARFFFLPPSVRFKKRNPCLFQLWAEQGIHDMWKVVLEANVRPPLCSVWLHTYRTMCQPTNCLSSRVMLYKSISFSPPHAPNVPYLVHVMSHMRLMCRGEIQAALYFHWLLSLTWQMGSR